MTTENPPTHKTVADEDTELIRAAIAGQPQAFPDLVRRYEKKLYSFARRMCRSDPDAEDLVQETFLNVHRFLADFRFETKFKNWLYRVAVNTAITKRRRSKFAPAPDLSLEDLGRQEGADATGDVPDWARMPLEQVLNGELLETLNRAIRSLPEKYRVVVVLRDVEEFSTEETAHILNLTPANVKVRLHRGRMLLKDKLTGYFTP